MAEQTKPHRVLERHEPRESIVAWFVILVLVLAMLGRAGLTFALVGERPRLYQYRSQSYIPASAYSSTEASPTTTTTSPPQVELPPAVVGKRSK